ncbi:MAG: ABC transporter permease [Myxococcales bacterium]|nr:ABC transporter permease [Myxococcales bacterium]
MRTVLLLAEKDLRLLVRDRGALFWACVFPLIFATLFGAIYPHETRERRIVVAVVDQAQDPASKQLAQGLAAQGLTLDPSRSADDASLRVRRGEAAAMLVVPAAFATGAPLALGVDPTKGAEAAWIEGALAKGLLSPGCALAPIERRPIADIVAPRTGFELAFPAAVLWGLIGCAGAFAAATVAERRSGTHLRLRSAPIRPITLLLGKLVACLIACTVDATVLLIAARVFFGVRVEKFLGLPVAIVCCAACFAGITVLLGSIGRTEQAVGGASWATLLLLAMVGGAMVPLSVMPAWMRAASCVSPVRWGISALEGATFRGLSVAELLPSCIVLVGFGLVSILCGAALARRESA